MKKIFQSFLLLCLFLCSTGAQAFDVIDQRISFIDSKYVTLGVGLGMTGFSMEKGISGDTGFGVRVVAGHHFNKYFQAEIGYQFSTFRFQSPDPVDTTLALDTRAEMNQEWIRILAIYPDVLLQPYISAGIGGYNLFGVNQETALDFSISYYVPLAAGLRAYLYKNKISFDAEYGYQILFGENQSADTLNLLGLNEVSFNTTSIMFTLNFHFL